MYFTSAIVYLSLLVHAHARVLGTRGVGRLAKHDTKPLVVHSPSNTSTGGSSGFPLSTPVPADFSVDATADPSYWLADIKHQGIAAFNSNPSSYTVFRNVMDYGATGKVRQSSSREQMLNIV